MEEHALPLLRLAVLVLFPKCFTFKELRRYYQKLLKQKQHLSIALLQWEGNTHLFHLEK